MNNTILIGGNIYDCSDPALPLKVNQEIFNWIHTSKQVHFCIEQTDEGAYILSWRRKMGNWFEPYPTPNHDDIHQFDIDLLVGMYENVFNPDDDPIDLQKESPYKRFHLNTMMVEIYEEDCIVEVLLSHVYKSSTRSTYWK